MTCGYFGTLFFPFMTGFFFVKLECLGFSETPELLRDLGGWILVYDV